MHGPEQIQLDGLTDFVGGVEDGLYGAAVFDFKSPHDMVEAKKSWFFFDEEYVCLGTAIQSDPDLPVATTINQALMRSEVSISQEGEIRKLPQGERELQNVKWAWHDQIGYIFPEPTTIHLSNQVEKGRWSDITDQKNISKEIVAKEVFALWFDHGESPNHASYAYIVAPNISEAELAETALDNRQIEILSNTDKLQAVKNNKLGISQMAFYQAGEVAVSPNLKVSMASPGMAMLKVEGNRIKELTLADPSRKLSRILLTVSGIYEAKGDHCIALPDKKQNQTLMIVDLPQGVYAGKSVRIEL